MSLLEMRQPMQMVNFQKSLEIVNTNELPRRLKRKITTPAYFTEASL